MLMRDVVTGKKDWQTVIPASCRVPYAEHRKRFESQRALICSAPVFDVTNVAEYLYQGNSQEIWRMFYDFPRPMPPFKTMWMEWKLPKTATTEGGVVHTHEPATVFKRCGCLIETIELTDRDRDPPFPFKPTQRIPRVIAMTVFAESLFTGEVLKLGGQTFGINEEFVSVSLSSTSGNVSYFFDDCDFRRIDAASREVMQQLGDETNSFSFPAMLALSLINCKNVTTKIIETPAALIKSQERKGHVVTRSHIVIEIQPITEAVRRISGLPGYTRAAASVIRGHFKDYSRGKGLFGKYPGMFWWDQRVAVSPGTTIEYQLKNATGVLDDQWPTA